MSKALLILGLGSVLALPAAPPFALNNPNQTPNKHELRALARTTGDAMRLLLARRGVKTIDGKPLFGGHGRVNNPTLKDIPISDLPSANEASADLVSNPQDKRLLVAAAQIADGVNKARCGIFHSRDAGRTWSGPTLVPQRNPDISDCTTPRLRYSADGTKLVLSFVNWGYDVDWSDPNYVEEWIFWDVDVSTSDDDGHTWSTPVAAIPAVPVVQGYIPCGPYYCFDTVVQDGTINDNPWVGISEDGEFVYASASRFNWASPPNWITLSRSINGGASFSMNSLEYNDTWTLFMQSPRIATAPGGRVLVAWYHSGADEMLRGSLLQHVSYSSNYGASFSSPSTAVQDSFELPAYLGPDGVYRVWWGASFPNLEIDSTGAAHMVYTIDPVANVPCTSHSNGFGNDACSTTPEDGDIRYVRSEGPPYTQWSSPITVNDDASGTSQGFPSLFVESVGRQAIVHVLWLDTRAGKSIPSTAYYPNCYETPAPGGCDSPNMVYDVYYSRLVPGAKRFSRNVRVNDMTMPQATGWDIFSLGIAATDSVLYGIWPDRRNLPTIFDWGNDLFGTRILP